jgi:hypothetical protein
LARERNPKVKQKPAAQKKQAKATANPDDFASQKLSWRMSLVDLAGAWGWHKLALEDVDTLRRLIKECETQTLASLKHARRAKEIYVSQLCSEARDRLPDIGLADREALWELRLGHQKWRAWGVVEGSTFNLVWWDPEHTVCKGSDMSKTDYRIR